MATKFAYHLKPDPTVAANMRAWAGWIESVLTTIGGWTVTTQTGDTPPSSLPGISSTVTSQKVGYRIYKMHDDFTDEFPIYMRIDFGSGAYGGGGLPVTTIGIWFSFGRGTDGAGNLTGVLWNGLGAQAGYPTVSGNDNTTSGVKNYETRSYASADNSRFVLGMFINEVNSSDTICFSLERSRDINGVYTGDGIQISFTDVYLGGGVSAQQCLSSTRYIMCADGGQPPVERGLSYVYPSRSPVVTYDGSIPVAILHHFKGVIQQPGFNTVIVGANEVYPETQFTMHIYGEDHIYQQLRNLCTARSIAGPGTSSSALADAGSRVCIRYD